MWVAVTWLSLFFTPSSVSLPAALWPAFHSHVAVYLPPSTKPTLLFTSTLLFPSNSYWTILTMDWNILPPDFALPGFASLVELTMVAQHMGHNQAILFLEQHWAKTGLEGVHTDWGNNENPAEEEGVPEQQNPGAPQQPGLEEVRGGWKREWDRGCYDWSFLSTDLALFLECILSYHNTW